MSYYCSFEYKEAKKMLDLYVFEKNSGNRAIDTEPGFRFGDMLTNYIKE